MEISVDGHAVKFRVDSGGDVSVMSLSTYQNVSNIPVLRLTAHNLRGLTEH